MVDEFEDIELGDIRNQITYNEDLVRDIEGGIVPRYQPPQPPQPPPQSPYYVAATAALVAGGLAAYNSRKKRDDDDKEKMTKNELEEMAIHKDMIEVQYANRKSAGRDFFASTNERTAIPESTLEDDRKLDVGDYKFVEASDLYALFENEKINKRVLAIRGLRPDLDFKDLKQAPRMGAQTVLKLNLDTGNQYKKDYEEVEDYLLNLPNYKDVVITGHSRGGETGLELARKHKLKAHIFQPVSVKNIEAVGSKEGIVDMKDSSLSEDDATITFTFNERRIYTNKEDTTPSNLVNPTDTSEKQYIIDYDPSLHSNTAMIPGFKQLSAHKLNNFHKEAVGYAASSKIDLARGDYHINHLTEQEAIELGYDMGDDDYDIGDDDYDIEDDFSTDEFANIRDSDLIVPVSKRSILFSDVPFIPNTSQMQQDKLDANGDGIVSYSEFYRYYKKRNYTDTRIKKLFKSLDSNNDGVLTANELI